jgi:hypothetical protein
MSPARGKRADLAGAAGAGVLGIGLGALLAQFVQSFALVLIAIGILLHAWGMLEKHRLEVGAAIPRWSKALYWLCWLALALLLAWISLAALKD